MTLVENIINKTNISKRKLNILCAPTHERYETNLTKTGHNFYAIRSNEIKDWYTTYAPVPENYVLLDKRLNPFEQVPRYVKFDLVLSQNKNGQFPVLKKIADQLDIPIITLEHTMPFPDWGEAAYREISKRYGDHNVFISKYSMNAWQEINMEPIKNPVVINHMINDSFYYDSFSQREKKILTVANDYINRDYCLNFKQYQKVTHGLPTFPVGDTEGLSKKAESLDQLVEFYNSCKVFLNTAHVSPIPMSLLEAMATGNIVVSCNTCAIPEYIIHGYNGYLANSDKEMRDLLVKVLNTPESDLKHIRYNAHKTIKDKCAEKLFLDSWNNLFYGAINGKS